MAKITKVNIRDEVYEVGPVQSVNAKTGDVVLSAGDLGLGNVSNTSDADKPVSTAVQTALDLKQDKLTAGTNITISDNVISSTGGGSGTVSVATADTLGGLKIGYDNTSTSAGVTTGVAFVVGTASSGTVYLNPNMTDDMYATFIAANSSVLDTSGEGTKLVTMSDSNYIEDFYTSGYHMISIYATASVFYLYCTSAMAAAFSSLGTTVAGWYRGEGSALALTDVTAVTGFSGTPTAVASLTGNTLFSNGTAFSVSVTDVSKLPLLIDSSTSKAYVQALAASDSFLGSVKTGYAGVSNSSTGTAFTSGGTTGTVYLNMGMTENELTEFAASYYPYASRFINGTGTSLLTFGTYSLCLSIARLASKDIISLVLSSSSDNSGYFIGNSIYAALNEVKAMTWYYSTDLTSSSATVTLVTDGALTSLSGLSITEALASATTALSNGTPFTYSHSNEGGLLTDSSGNGYANVSSILSSLSLNDLANAKMNATLANLRMISSKDAYDTDFSISPCYITDAASTDSVHGMFDSDNSKIVYMPFVYFKNSHKNLSKMCYGMSNLLEAPQVNTDGVTDMSSMFYGCTRLQSVPQYATDDVTTMNSTFCQCYQLAEIPAWNCISVTDFANCFHLCYRLTHIHAYHIKASFDISSSTMFTESALVEILENLETVSNQTLTMGSTNLAKLTDADKLIATGKGWTLA